MGFPPRLPPFPLDGFLFRDGEDPSEAIQHIRTVLLQKTYTTASDPRVRFETNLLVIFGAIKYFSDFYGEYYFWKNLRDTLGFHHNTSAENLEDIVSRYCEGRKNFRHSGHASAHQFPSSIAQLADEVSRLDGVRHFKSTWATRETYWHVRLDALLKNQNNSVELSGGRARSPGPREYGAATQTRSSSASSRGSFPRAGRSFSDYMSRAVDTPEKTPYKLESPIPQVPSMATKFAAAPTKPGRPTAANLNDTLSNPQGFSPVQGHQEHLEKTPQNPPGYTPIQASRHTSPAATSRKRAHSTAGDAEGAAHKKLALDTANLSADPAETSDEHNDSLTGKTLVDAAAGGDAMANSERQLPSGTGVGPGSARDPTRPSNVLTARRTVENTVRAEVLARVSEVDAKLALQAITIREIQEDLASGKAATEEIGKVPERLVQLEHHHQQTSTQASTQANATQANRQRIEEMDLRLRALEQRSTRYDEIEAKLKEADRQSSQNDSIEAQVQLLREQLQQRLDVETQVEQLQMQLNQQNEIKAQLEDLQAQIRQGSSTCMLDAPSTPPVLRSDPRKSLKHGNAKAFLEAMCGEISKLRTDMKTRVREMHKEGENENRQVQIAEVAWALEDVLKMAEANVQKL